MYYIIVHSWVSDSIWKHSKRSREIIETHFNMVICSCYWRFYRWLWLVGVVGVRRVCQAVKTIPCDNIYWWKTCRDKSILWWWLMQPIDRWLYRLERTGYYQPPGWCGVTPTSADWWPGLTHKLSVSQHAQQTGRSLLAPPLLLRQLRQLGRPANLRPGQSRSVWATQDSFSAGHSSE